MTLVDRDTGAIAGIEKLRIFARLVGGAVSHRAVIR